MKKVVLGFLLLLFTVSLSYAAPIQLDSGTYTPADGYGVVAQIDDARLGHNRYYTWGLKDRPIGDSIASMDIVFHSIYDDSNAANYLNVYIFNEPAVLGYDQPGRDESDPNLPNWADVYSATLIGTWSYNHDLYSYEDGERFDVVFTVTDPELLSYLSDGESWGIGFDPDCYFYAESVSVVAPVPEPASMLLFGMGLLGLAGVSRKKMKV